MKKRAIVWFRQDLRLHDNPALSHAALDHEIVPIYILDDEERDSFRMGAASRFWLHHSLDSLDHSLQQKLNLYVGKAHTVISELATRLDVSAVFWNRCYEPWRTARDSKLKDALLNQGLTVQSFNGSLLWEPWQVLKDDKSMYKVFTPFYKAARKQDLLVRDPQPKPSRMSMLKDTESHSLESLKLLPSIPWDTPLKKSWHIGEEAAHKKLSHFLNHGLRGYKEGRNEPARDNVSRLSPHLHFGEISPHQVWHQVLQISGKDLLKDRDHFLSELGWREFSYYLLFHFPNLPRQNFQKKFDAFPWIDDKKALKAWQKGQTGYPLVDAGMRELWQTGYMHNRVRMVVASFLVKNLLLHWHHGEAWFWDCLVDADLANNSASWQWVQGSGADAAPYFRIFNPITQGEKFDPLGLYTKKFVPELKLLPNKYLFKPWEAPDGVMAQANIKLGVTYPKPIIDLGFSRERALEAFSLLKNHP